LSAVARRWMRVENYEHFAVFFQVGNFFAIVFESAKHTTSALG
jgi:hypothetical protein